MPRRWKHPPISDAEFAALSPQEKAARTGRMPPEERAEKRATEWGPAREARDAERGNLGGAKSGGRKPMAQRKVPELVEQAVQQIAWDSRVFITLVGRSVPYSAYATQLDAENRPLLSVEMHRRRVGLALLDLFTEHTEEEKAANLSTKATVLDVAHLSLVRQRSLWREILGKVQEAASALAGCKSMEDFAERLEPVLAQEHLRVAIMAGSPRDRMKGADEMTGRRSAKKGRSVPEHQGLFIGEGVLDRLGAMLGRSEKLVHELPPAGEEEPS